METSDPQLLQTKYLRRAVLVACILTLVSCQSRPSTSLAIVNGSVWTGTGLHEMAEAVFVEDGIISFVGTTDEVRDLTNSNTHVIDAGGATVAPGFIDSHTHILEGGYRLTSVQLRDASTKQEFINRIAAYASTLNEGEWILGGDWDHTHWGGDLPERSWIDSVTTGHPVWVTRLDGHSGLANTAALKKADALNPEDIQGGEIVRKDGEPTGLLKDNAMNMIWRSIEDPSADQNDNALDSAIEYLLSNGVTSVHDMGGTSNEHETFERAARDGRLRVRIYSAFPLSRAIDAAERMLDYEPQGLLRYGSVKGFVDGSLGSHTAAFFEPYSDQPDDRGLFVIDMVDLQDRIRLADSLGLQVMIHAIGDRAIHELLNLYEGLGPEVARQGRHRIEHNQHLSPRDFTRFKELGVIASMQPYHAADDGRWAESVIGPSRSKFTYAFRTLLDHGAKLAFGSDWFVAPPTPIEGIWAAVTRQTLDGENPDGWIPQEKITLDEALWAYTAGAAYAGFQESKKGVIRPGALADLVVLDADLFKLDSAKEIRNVRVAYTIVGGAVVFTKE